MTEQRLTKVWKANVGKGVKLFYRSSKDAFKIIAAQNASRNRATTIVHGRIYVRDLETDVIIHEAMWAPNKAHPIIAEMLFQMDRFGYGDVTNIKTHEFDFTVGGVNGSIKLGHDRRIIMSFGKVFFHHKYLEDDIPSEVAKQAWEHLEFEVTENFDVVYTEA